MSTQAPQVDEQGSSKHTLTPIEDEPTIGRLVADASRDISSLIHNEIALAKSELKISVKNGGTGAGMFAGAALFGLLGIVMFSIAAALLINFTGLAHAYCFSVQDVAQTRRTISNYLTLAGRVPAYEVRFCPGLEHLPAVLDTLQAIVGRAVTES